MLAVLGRRRLSLSGLHVTHSVYQGRFVNHARGLTAAAAFLATVSKSLSSHVEASHCVHMTARFTGECSVGVWGMIMLAAELRVAAGKQKGKAIPLKIGKFMVGRGEDCHLRPNNELVSRHHCVFTVDEFVVRLRDLGSTNGTFVNGERIRGQVILNHGDKVAVGKLEFEVSLKGAMVHAAALPVGTVIDSDSSAGDIPSFDATRTMISEGEEAAESDTGTFAKGQTVTIPVFNPTPVAPEPEPEYQVEETAYGTSSEFPSGPPAPPPMMPPGPAYGAFGQMMPGMPQPMYPQMPMGYGQMGGYPGYPGMPMMYPQYPGQGFAPMPGPVYPPAPALAAPVAPDVIEEEEVVEAVSERKGIPVKLPDPKETGAKASAPAAKKPAGGAPQAIDPKNAAANILKQMSQRRPT